MPKQTKFYAVKIGHQPGIYPCWENGAKEQVMGVTGAVYKSFKTIEEAQIFMDKRSVTMDSVKNEHKWQQMEIKRVKTGYEEGYITKLNNDELESKYSNNMDSPEAAITLISNIKLETIHPRYWNYHQGAYYIFTDGSLIPNKHVGYGICLSVSNINTTQKVNCLYRVMPLGTTNNQCEMLAILTVLYIMWIFREYFGNLDTTNKKLFGKKIYIVSDSMYCINAVSKWMPTWIRDNWYTKTGTEVKNQHILKKINELLQNLKPYIDIQFLHQNSHIPAPPKDSTIISRLLWEGNYLVDLAAKQL